MGSGIFSIRKATKIPIIKPDKAVRRGQNPRFLIISMYGNEIYLNSYLQFELNQFFYRKLNGAYSKYRFFSKGHGICEKRKRFTV